ncbi:MULTISPECIES: ATP-binding protein [Micrococcaceae]|uniref:ATP-binding protein n=1 Tax=Micrococcaceae TaxID=1268 RepID=UPI0016082C3F|nr:PAS domain-containing sensor histidine kinase [Citricoccus sp.]MBB5749931.1 signal transduction histidine kinase [Micrococcus sp. TA1]HRO31248.1 PAS domain-containing sensor histidine kinase [Citricoccus sp.]HRO93212.1 PAS domain-containing sensor histidine kinase [Citricoccus sp.]
MPSSSTPLIDRPAEDPAQTGPGYSGVQRSYFGQFSLRRRVLISQLPLALSVLAVVLLCVVGQKSQVLSSPVFLAGVAAVGVLTVLAGIIPWDRVPGIGFWVIPVLDFVPIAAIWDATHHSLYGTSILTAFPVFWLAWSGLYPVLGITLGVVGTTLTIWGPHALNPHGSARDHLLESAAVPLFMLALAVAASVLTRSLDRQREELDELLSITRQQNRRLQTVLDTTDVGIVVTDRDGNDLLMNPAQRRVHLIGLPHGVEDAPERDLLLFEADGKTPIPAEDRPAHRAVRGESFSGRLIAIGVDGSQQFLSVSAQAMRDENGTFDGTVLVFQNVTDLLDAIQAREKFLADISHELRTPLTSIIGFLDLAVEDNQDETIIGYLNTSQRNADRLLTLVNDLLQTAAGGTAVTPEPTDLARLVRHSAESAQIQADNAGITLQVRAPDTLIMQADPVKMNQVADNLISNAIKYTPTGGTVTVSAAPAGDCAELIVTDTGIGISAEEQQKLFTNFYRTEHVRRAAIPGTGLGLAITRGLVRAHGGEITVTSEKGTGSTFTVSLPVDGPATGTPANASTSPR